MKKYKFFFIVAGLLMAYFLSCKKTNMVATYQKVGTTTAQLKFIDASPYFRTMYNAQDSFNIIVNGAVISSPFLSYNSIFPASGTAYGYVSVPAGQGQIKLSVPGTLTGDSIQIKTFSQSLLSDSLYTFFITDSAILYTSDSHIQPLTGFFNLRFINLVLNDTAGKAVDIWSTRYNNIIFKGITPKLYTSFSQFAYNTVLSDTLIVRRSGTTFALDTLAGVSFTNQRTYTLYYKGDGNLGGSPWVNVTKVPKRRHLAVYVNQ